MSSPNNPFAASELKFSIPRVTPQYSTISPLPCVAYRRGKAVFLLNPYSGEHAFLTGNHGTPTMRTTLGVGGNLGVHTGGYPSVIVTPNLDHSPQSDEAASCSGGLGEGCGHILIACLLSSQGDIPQQAITKGVRTQPVDGLLDEGSIEAVAGLLEDNLEDFQVKSPNSATSAIISAGSDTCDTKVGDGGDEPGSPSGASRKQAEVQPRPTSPLALGLIGDEAHYVAEPVETNHHRFSPYKLRSTNRRALTRRIGAQAKALCLPFDHFILRQAGIKRFNPAIPSPTHIDWLYDCASATGRGITIAQFGKIFKRCMSCDHIVFSTQRKRGHDCNAPSVNVKAPGFQLTDYFFNETCLGLTEKDFADILNVCDTCLRVHLIEHADWHKCPEGDVEFVDDTD